MLARCLCPSPALYLLFLHSFIALHALFPCPFLRSILALPLPSSPALSLHFPCPFLALPLPSSSPSISVFSVSFSCLLSHVSIIPSPSPSPYSTQYTVFFIGAMDVYFYYIFFLFRWDIMKMYAPNFKRNDGRFCPSNLIEIEKKISVVCYLELLMCSILAHLWRITAPTKTLKCSVTRPIMSGDMRQPSFLCWSSKLQGSGDYCRRFFPWDTTRESSRVQAEVTGVGWPREVIVSWNEWRKISMDNRGVVLHLVVRCLFISNPLFLLLSAGMNLYAWVQCNGHCPLSPYSHSCPQRCIAQLYYFVLEQTTLSLSPG